MSSLLEQLPVYTLGLELNDFCKICLYYLLPSVLGLIIYLLLILSDFSLGYELVELNHPGWGSITLFLMFVPAIAGTIFILSSLDRWPSNFQEFGKENIRFLMLNLWHLIGFPFAASYRFVHQMFWSVEALCANYSLDLDRRENALRILMKPNSMELYFFLQAYLHSAPNVILQFYIIFGESYPNHELGFHRDESQ